MAQLVVAAAGAALGGFLAPGIVAFGMTGASIGWMAGSMLGSAFAPTQKGAGPQLSDLSVSTSAYGTPIPYVQGHPRIAGQIVWASNKREIATTTEQGKGGGGAEYTSYTYEVDLLILLTDNQIPGIARVWQNGELTFDGSIKNGFCQRITAYTGASTQLPDPDYEAAVGTANAPAYRGRGSVFIKSLQLGSGGQIPNLTFEIGKNAVSANVRLLTVFDDALTNDISTYNEGPGSATNLVLSDGNLRLNNSIYSNTTLSWGLTRRALGTPQTFEFIFKHAGNPADYTSSFVLARFNDGNANNELLFTISGYYLPFGIDHQLQITPASGGTSSPLFFSNATTAQTGFDIHVAVVIHNDTETSIFYDGQRVINRAADIRFSPLYSSYVNIGGDNAVTQNCIVDIKGVRLTNLALYDSATYTPPTALSFSEAGSYSVANKPLRDVVDALLLLTGLSASQFDTAALAVITRPVRSMAISSVSSARTVLDMLAQSYHFEAVLSDKIYFRPRATAPAATLTFNELGVVVDSGNTPDPLPLTQANELEIPAQMALTYSNVEGDYQTDTQYSDRLLTGQESTSAMQVPLGFTATEAKQIVDAMLLDKAVSALTTSVSLGVTRAALEPTDVVLLTGEDGSRYRMRIVKKSEASGVTTLECVQDDSTVFTQTGATAGGTTSQTTVLATPATTLELLDVPLLRDVDNLPGHYVAVKGSAANWTSAGLYDSLDNLTFTPNTTISSQAAMGTCTTVLADWAGGNVFDEVSSVTVNVGTQQLVSVTRDDILASQSTNAALIGSEVLQYRTATLVSAGVYTLSGFLRGQRGTASTGHSVSERFILLASGGLRFVPLQAGDLGRLRYYKAASAGQKLSAVTSQSLTPAGITLKPFAPVGARANRDTSDTVLTWIRQTRLSTRIVGTLGISSPLGEAAESYEVEIYTAGHAALLRTLTSSTPTATYTSAQQVTDFGSAPTSIAIKVYQISATVGRGTPLTTTV